MEILTIFTDVHLLEIIEKWITILGVPVAVCLFLKEKKKDRQQREEEAFDKLDEAYVEFMEICLQHPDVDISEVQLDPATYHPSASDLRTEHTAFSILLSLFERVVLMFEDKDEGFRARQYTGWIQFMKRYAERENFKRVWKDVATQFDTHFQDKFNKLLAGQDIARNEGTF
jgi:hypothetical protein